MLAAERHDAHFEKRYQSAIERAREYSKSLEGPSLLERLAALPVDTREEILRRFTTEQLAALRYDWKWRARPKQDPDLADVPHRTLFWLGGRGSGKTKSGANRVRQRIMAGARSIAFIGPTTGEIERYQINGEGGADGIMTVFPKAVRPEYVADDAVIFFHRPECRGCGSAKKCGGAVAYVHTAEVPEFRGPNLDTVWFDEPAKARYLSKIWSNIELATRLRGTVQPEIILTGTPRPLQLFREIIADDDTVTILIRQAENAGNLDPSYVGRMQRKYGGTRLGRQELEGEVLTDNPDALFHAAIFEATRVEAPPVLVEVAVAVDPAISTKPENDDSGIVGGGRDAAGHVYVMVDATEKASPERWGDIVVQTCRQLQADTVVGERNRGGDLVAANVRAAKMRKSGAAAANAIKIVEVHATRGKAIRAEPVSALHERGMLHIVGNLPELEQETTEWNPKLGGESPNRLDALVWLVWHLARLGEEEEEDYSAGFRGLPAVTAAIQKQARSGSPASSGLAGSLPRAAWGSKL